MIPRLRLVLALALFATSVLAAQYIPITSSNTVDKGIPLVSGTYHFAPYTSTGVAASFQLPGGGQSSVTPIDCKVVSGHITTATTGQPCQLADTSATIPQNVCYRVTLQTPTKANILGPGYDCVQPTSANTFWCSSGSCNFDRYQPLFPPIASVIPGPTGATGPPGCVVGQTCLPSGIVESTITFTALSLAYKVQHNLGTLNPIVQFTYPSADGAVGGCNWYPIDANNTMITCPVPATLTVSLLNMPRTVVTAQLP